MASNLTPVFAYGFVYCQRHHHRPGVVLKVTSSIVEDYTCLVPASLPFLQTLASHSPLMACQLMIALISLYPVVTIGKQQGKQKLKEAYNLLHPYADFQNSGIPVSSPILDQNQNYNTACKKFKLFFITFKSHNFTQSCISDERSSATISNQPPLSLLKVVASWVGKNPDLCLLTCPTSLLTAGCLRGSLAPAEPTPLPLGPILGLLRWVVLMPLACDSAICDRHSYHESRLLYSQLHLAIIEAFLLAGKDKEDPQEEMELEPGEVMDESDSRHLIKGTDLKELTQDMSKLIDRLKTAEFNHSIIDQQVQLSMDRFAQTLQVAIATGCLSSSKGNLCADIDSE